MNIILLFVSVCTGAGRSIFSKKMSTDSVQSSKCFLNQLVMFLGAAGIIAVFYFRNLFNTTPITILWGIGFGIFAFLAQWCYMLALSKGPTSICTMIYSFGFLLPTMAGTLFWDEPFGITSVIGILLAVAAIITSALSSGKTTSGKSFLLPNLIAMLSSGMLGILQKTHQKSPDSGNLGPFLVIAFLVSGLIAFVFMRKTKPGVTEQKNSVIYPVLTGACFGLSSMLNTFLAGRLPSDIMFPTSNIGVMLACIIAEFLLFKHTPTKSQIAAFILGVLSVLTLSIRL